jgi:uncharacterized protein
VGVNPLHIYFDACIAIYLVEQHQTFAPLIRSRLTKQAQTNEAVIQISSLTEMECLVMPLRKRNQPLLDKFHHWFEEVEVLTIERAVFRHAAQLRAEFPGLKTPDAIHLATALHYGCDSFGPTTTG